MTYQGINSKMEGTEALVKPVGLDSGIHEFESFFSHFRAERAM